MTQENPTEKNKNNAEDSHADEDQQSDSSDSSRRNPDPSQLPPEYGGTKGPEPTRYGDWENKGRCTDF